MNLASHYAIPFSDARQCARVCRALLHRVGLEQLWSLGGPTAEAIALHDAPGDKTPFSGRDQLVVFAAWLIWVRRGDSACIRSLDLLAEMNDEMADMLDPLIEIVDRGPSGVDSWLSLNGVPDASH